MRSMRVFSLSMHAPSTAFLAKAPRDDAGSSGTRVHEQQLVRKSAGTGQAFAEAVARPAVERPPREGPWRQAGAPVLDGDLHVRAVDVELADAASSVDDGVHA